MSTIAKRVIWAGPADGSNDKPLKVEGIALSAATLPGTVVQQVATGLQDNAQAATVFGQVLLVADKDEHRSRSVDDAWTQNESMVAIQPRSGEFLNMLVADGNDITSRGVALTRNGAGLLTIAATDGSEEIVAYSDEIIDTTGADQLVHCKIA